MDRTDRLKLKMTARPDTPAQIAPSGVQAFERYVRVNNDAIRVHSSDGGMNFCLLADHQSAFVVSAR